LPDPEYKISIQSGYVLVEDPPDYDVVWIEQPSKLQAISAACSEAGFRKVLLRGSNINVKLTEFEVFKLGEEVTKLNLMVAIVQLHDASKQTERFLENVAANRGLPIKFFDNEQDARDWLGV
jgi:hypothetical protein